MAERKLNVSIFFRRPLFCACVQPDINISCLMIA
ncbi:unnamed protein product [Ixodes pacificus]